MPTPRELVSVVRDRLASYSDSAERIGASFRFELEEGDCIVMRLCRPCSVLEANEAKAARGAKDCVVQLGSDDFVALLRGQRSARELFLSGRLRLRGDIVRARDLVRVVELLG